MPPADLLTTAQVATRLKVTRQTVLNYVRTGRLRPAKKLPTTTGAYLFTADDIDRFVDEQAA